MKKLLMTTAALAALISLSYAQSIPVDGNTWLSACTSPRTSPSYSLCVGYVRGFADGLITRENWPPSNVTTTQLIDVSVRYLRNHPEIRHTAVNALLLKAFNEAWPREARDASQQSPPAQRLEDVRKKAESGDAIAQLTLGRMYANGMSVAKDETQSVAWFQKAAGQGNADAQYALGLSYDTGGGVTRDGSQALDWYKKAAEQGHKEARNRLDEGASIIQLIRSTVTRMQNELPALPFESRDQIKEIAARLATARDTMPFSDLHALRVEADSANGVLDKANEFRRVSEIASSRIASIEAELTRISSDAPIILEIQDAIKSVRLEQKGSNLNALQDTFEKLNKLYDTNRDQLGQWKFKVH
jgi:hypothetical protein